MEQIRNIIRKKPILFVLATLLLILGTGVMKWQVSPPKGALLYALGAFFGIYFLDIAESFFALSPSPFRSAPFAAAFSLVSFFVVSSSGSLFAAGLVLSLYLTLILRQLGELRSLGHLTSWYSMIAGTVTLQVQKYGFVIFVFFFLIQTLLFIRTQ